MEIEILANDDGSKQLYIDGICHSEAHQDSEECYKEFIKEIISQKGIIEYETSLKLSD